MGRPVSSTGILLCKAYFQGSFSPFGKDWLYRTRSNANLSKKALFNHRDWGRGITVICFLDPLVEHFEECIESAFFSFLYGLCRTDRFIAEDCIFVSKHAY